MTYSLDLRERAVAKVEGGMSRRAAARQFMVSESSVIKWARRKEETGSLAPAPRRKSYASRLNRQKDWLLSLIEAEPDLTLAEIAERLAERDVQACPSAIWRFFQRHRISYKKKRARLRAGAAGRGGCPRTVPRRAAAA